MVHLIYHSFPLSCQVPGKETPHAGPEISNSLLKNNYSAIYWLYTKVVDLNVLFKDCKNKTKLYICDTAVIKLAQQHSNIIIVIINQ